MPSNTCTPAFHKDFWSSGLSKYSPMKNVAKTAEIANQTNTPQHPSFLMVDNNILF